MFNVCIGCTVLPTPVPNPSDPTSINTRSYRRFLLQDGEKSGEGGGGGGVCRSGGGEDKGAWDPGQPQARNQKGPRDLVTV